MGPLHALLCWRFASGEGEKCTWGDPRLGTALWVGLISWSPERESNVCFVEVAFVGRAHWVFLNMPAVKTGMLPRNVEGCWEWLSAVPWQHLKSKPHDVDLPASTVGDTMPASGHPKGHQRCHFTGSSGNKTHFPQVSGWDFASGPFLGSHVRKTLVYVILLFLPCFFYIPLVTSGGPFHRGMEPSYL